MKLIEDHYRANRRNFVKRMSYPAGDYAEDVVQEAYYRALKYSNSFNGENFDKWFSIILNNALRHHKNSEKGFAASSFDEDDQDGIVCNRFSERVVAEIYELIDTKSLVQQEVLTHHFKQGYGAKGVSEISEHSAEKCRQIIHRFREELRDLYGRD